MRVEEVRKLLPIQRFWHWIRERHQVCLRRAAGMAPPWTEDEAIQGTYFTNISRELDKTTVWFRRNVRTPLMEQPGVLFATLCFRWFNLPATGEILLGGNYLQGWRADWDRRNLLTDWDLQTAVLRLKAWQGAGNKIFTGAFNISNGGSTKDKITRVCEDYLEPAWTQRERLAGLLGGGSLACACEHLKALPGLGGTGFMAAQAVADLKYTALLSSAPDWWTWASPGPGSVQGLRLLYPAFTPGEFLPLVNHLQQEYGARFPKYPRLHAQDVQNCLCEFGKYEQVLRGGRAKRNYHGGA